MMASRAEREGEAGQVTGPFLSKIERPNYPNKAITAAFLERKDLALFTLAAQLKQAMNKDDKDAARAIFQEIRELEWK
jgi:hypothetical protein